MTQLGEAFDAKKAILEAMEEFPKEEGFQDQLINQLRAENDLPAAIEILKERIELKPDERKLALALAETYLRGYHYRFAHQVLEGITKVAPEVESVPEESLGQQTPPATMQLVKKHWDEDDKATAALTFRRIWRRFPDDRDPSRRFYSSRSLGRYQWPVTQRAAVATLPRGGMPPLDPDEKPEPTHELDEEGEEDVPAVRKATLASDMLATSAEGLAEVRDWLRTFDGAAQDSEVAVDLFLNHITNGKDVQSTPDVEVPILRALQSGMGGKIHNAALFRILEQNEELRTPAIGQIIDDLLASLLPSESAQVRRLAKLYTAFGETGKAAKLYRWCSLGGGLELSRGLAVVRMIGGMTVYRSGPAARESTLLDEVSKNFEGQTRIDLIETILSAADPGPEACASVCGTRPPSASSGGAGRRSPRAPSWSAWCPRACGPSWPSCSLAPTPARPRRPSSAW
jgi:hypothetical protein